MTGGRTKNVRQVASRLAVRRGEFVQLRRRLLAQTWVWLGVFVVVATLLVAPGRTLRFPILEAGEVASSDIVVDRDVTLSDPESTEEKRRRASEAVLSVYLFDTDMERQVLSRLERLFLAGRAESRGSAQELATRLSDASELEIQPFEAEVLRRSRFSDEVQTVLSEVVRRLYRQGIVGDRLELLHSSDRGVTLRFPDGTERVELDIYRFVDGAFGLNEVVEQRLAAEPEITRAMRVPMASFLTRLLTPNVNLDRAETLARRLRAANSVEEVSIRLPRGRVLVRRGDEVTDQTARLLSNLAARRDAEPTLLPLGGVLVLVVLVTAIWYFFLLRESPSTEEFRSRFGAVVLLTLFMLLALSGVVFLARSIAGSMMREPFGQLEIYLAALPHAAGPIVAALMFGLPVAVLFAVLQGVLVTLMIGGEVSLALYAVLSGVAAAFASQRLKERNVLARVAMNVAGINAVIVLGLSLWHDRAGDWQVVAASALSGAGGGLLAAALASFVLPLVESVTGAITDIRLLELSNPNLPLLRRLAQEAPGTFQHSLAMANLSEAAAEAVGGNPLLARVSCYYHDIGKLTKPEYFVENQRGGNPHDQLTPWMSALVVSNHVKAGLELARQYRLPELIRDAIATHHGTKLIRFFYSRAKAQEDPDKGQVKESEFRYPGPKPHTKELGILMLADAVEAASRTLQEPSPVRIQTMIAQIVKKDLEDEQLDNCDLTLRDLEKIEAAFFWVLTTAFHHRIDYPDFDFNRRGRG